MTAPRTTCILVAAGSGVRLAHGRPKALVVVRGRTLLAHAVDGIARARLRDDSCAVDGIVVVAPAEHVGRVTLLATAAWSGAGRELPPVVVPGGTHRQESVRAGLVAAAGHAPDLVLVHDAARAFTPSTVVADVVRALREGHPAVLPGVAVSDTVKQVQRRPDTPDLVQRTLVRADLVAAQTPQGFRTDVLRSAHDRATVEDPAGLQALDDAGLVERDGVAVVVVPGDPMAFKVTTAFDVLVAEALLAAPG